MIHDDNFQYFTVEVDEMFFFRTIQKQTFLASVNFESGTKASKKGK